MIYTTGAEIMTLKLPIKHNSLQKTVYDLLRTAILNGELSPGEQISLGEIAKNLNVSTMPVREALRTLEAQGMITFSSQKKITVSQLSAVDLEEFYWIRIPLECRSFARNFSILGSEEIKELDKLHQLMSDVNTSGPEWVRLNRKFHMILYGTEKSRVLKGALAWLWNNVTAYLNLYAQEPSLVEKANQSHAKLIQAIKEKRDQEALEVLREHLKSGLLLRATLKRTWGDAGNETPP